MSFTPPSNLKDLIFHWWKIIDSPEINKDYLTNFISFDLSMFPLVKTNKIIAGGVERGYLMEDTKNEILSLSPAMEEEFQQWQDQGQEKAQKMMEVLNITWRKNQEFDDSVIFEIMKYELFDKTIEDKSQFIPNSHLNIEKIDFSEKISGTIKKEAQSDDKAGNYTFVLDRKNKIISHDCPIYTTNYKEKKQFCEHLARVINKLYSKDSEKTVNLIEMIVENKEDWKFE